MGEPQVVYMFDIVDTYISEARRIGVYHGQEPGAG